MKLLCILFIDIVIVAQREQSIEIFITIKINNYINLFN